MKPISNRGIITPVSKKCHCGGTGMLQEWIEPVQGLERYKRMCVIFCQECDNKTKIYTERTAEEARRECVIEWNTTNEKAKRSKAKTSKM